MDFVNIVEVTNRSVGVVMEETYGICMPRLNMFEQGDLDARHVERHSQYCRMVLLSTNDLVIRIIGKWWNRDAVAAPVIEDCPEEAKSNTVERF